jgi:hypothetical protein
MPTVGLNKTQADALNRHLACGKPSLNGFFLAAKQNGMFETFAGKDLVLADAVTRTLLSIDADLDPYFISNTDKLLAIRSSDATAVTAAGIVVASGSTPAALRLTCRDANAANALGVSQEGSLWIPTSTPWSAQFEMIVPTNAYAVGVAFQEVGFMGAGNIATHFIDASKEFGYVDGSADAPFVSLKFAAGQGTLRVRAAAGGSISTSSAFNIPASGKHVYRLEYGYSSAGGTPAVALFIDDVFVTSVTATIAGALQFAARACHGATYSATSHIPPALDLNLIGVAVYS